MHSTLNRVHDPRNPERRGLSDRCSREQVTHAPERVRPASAEHGVRASYDIDPGDTVEAVVCALLLVPLSIVCVVLVGLCRAAGAR